MLIFVIYLSMHLIENEKIVIQINLRNHEIINNQRFRQLSLIRLKQNIRLRANN